LAGGLLGAREDGLGFAVGAFFDLEVRPHVPAPFLSCLSGLAILFQDAARFALRVFLSAERAIVRHHTHRRRPLSALDLDDFNKSRGFIALKEISGKHVIVLPKMAVNFSRAFAHLFSFNI
jgi:hypothetical protein